MDSTTNLEKVKFIYHPSLHINQDQDNRFIKMQRARGGALQWHVKLHFLTEKPAAASGSHLNVSGTSNCSYTCEIS